MGIVNQPNGIILLMDSFSKESSDLYTSFKLSDTDVFPVVIDDDGFLPEDVVSVYGFFLGDFDKEEGVKGRPRYFNQINVPEFWEISGTNKMGKIHNLSKERGRIFYVEPHHKRLVKVVDWYDDKGVVRTSDHYNRYGALYARTVFNRKGQRVNKSYFDAKGREIIVENYVTKNIILQEGNQVIIFAGKLEFVLYFMKKIKAEDHRIFFNSLSTSFFVSERISPKKREDILFWQEKEREDIPGNMTVILNHRSNRTNLIMVQNKAAYQSLIRCGADPKMMQQCGYIYPFMKENKGRPSALICTNSDRIEQLDTLIESFPEVHFHIAAVTEMSSKLTENGKYDNVSLYPGIKDALVKELFAECDFYLDINYESEILSAVREAFLHRHLIFSFRETLHQKQYIAAEHIYPSKEADRLIRDWREVLKDKTVLEQRLKLQQNAGLSEEKERYLF